MQKANQIEMVWVRVRLRDVLTPRMEDTDHAKENQAAIQRIL